MNKKKFISIILTLALVLGMLAVQAYATTYDLPTPSGAKVDSISADMPCGYTLTQTTEPFSFQGFTNYRYTYNITLNGAVADGTSVGITMTPENGATVANFPPIQQFFPMIGGRGSQPLSLTATVQNGSASIVMYLHRSFTTGNIGKCDIYTFNFTVAEFQNPLVDTNNTGLTMRFGDPAYPNTAPECYMGFVGSNGTYNAVYNGPLENYYPDMLSFYVTDGTNNISSMNGGSNIHFVEYDDNGNVTRDESTPSSSQLRSGVYTLKIMHEGDLTITASGQTTTIHFATPQAASATVAGCPSNVMGYLTGASQYANSTPWGSISTDNLNSLASQGALKGVNGYTAYGYSLGSLGGYVQYDFSTSPITNDATHPYGVDFVIYGNAFNGNPEAAAVQVYGKTADGNWAWYELAGSKYYDSATLRNQYVVYDYDGDSLSAGVGSSETSAIANLNAFGSASWFPRYDNLNHSITSNIGGTRTSNYLTQYNDNTIVYKGVTSIEDSDDTAFYAFGYADVTPNGTPSTYGAPVNPYIPYTNTKTGGDGFDLSWAVDISTGLPVAISEAKYVRIYSAVLHNTGIFGETSPEICGIYKVVGSGDGNASVIPTIKRGLTTISTSNNSYKYVASGNYSLSCRASYVYINGVMINTSGTYNFTLRSGDVVQIISQNGTESPYVTVLCCN